jgi:hypothetical protein
VLPMRTLQISSTQRIPMVAVKKTPAAALGGPARLSSAYLALRMGFAGTSSFPIARPLTAGAPDCRRRAAVRPRGPALRLPQGGELACGIIALLDRCPRPPGPGAAITRRSERPILPRMSRRCGATRAWWRSCTASAWPTPTAGWRTRTARRPSSVSRPGAAAVAGQLLLRWRGASQGRPRRAPVAPPACRASAALAAWPPLRPRPLQRTRNAAALLFDPRSRAGPEQADGQRAGPVRDARAVQVGLHQQASCGDGEAAAAGDARHCTACQHRCLPLGAPACCALP